MAGAGGRGHGKEGASEVGSADSHLELELSGLLVQVGTPAALLQGLHVQELLHVAQPETVQGDEGGVLETFLGKTIEAQSSLLFRSERFV